MRTLASLSAARCAYIFGCSDTLSMLLACGNEERPLDRLGSATSLCLSAGTLRELDCWSVVIAKDKAKEDWCTKANEFVKEMKRIKETRWKSL